MKYILKYYQLHMGWQEWWQKKNTFHCGICSYNQHIPFYVLVQQPFLNGGFQASTVSICNQLCQRRFQSFIPLIAICAHRGRSLLRKQRDCSKTSNNFTQVLISETILKTHLRSKVTTNIEIISQSLRRWYISMNIIFLDIFHRTVFMKNHFPVYFSKHNVSKTGFCLRLQVKPSELGTSSIDWAQLNKFYLRTEAESSLRNVVFWKIKRTVFLDKDGTMEND
jgi:hypothetical protein